jgi:hypothetical protein
MRFFPFVLIAAPDFGDSSKTIIPGFADGLVAV